MPKHTIAILHHENQTPGGHGYLFTLLRKIWEAQGMTVIDLYGTKKPTPADLLFIHVDLSYLPDEYQAFARKYPKHINAKAIDIRKSSYCPNLLKRNDSWRGPVIVKSNCNFAGRPERRAANQKTKTSLQKLQHKLMLKTGLKHRPLIWTKEDYKIFDSLTDTPKAYFHKDYVVQKFTPELRNGEYVLREYYFLGDQSYHNMETSGKAVITSGTQIESGYNQSTPTALLDMRHEIGLDYGKIDYAIVDGEVVIFDANKTVGTRMPPSENTVKMANHLASGLQSIIKTKAAAVDCH